MMEAMKIRTIIFALFVLTASSCNLNENPKSVLVPENSFKTETELRYYVNGLLPDFAGYVDDKITEDADNGVFPTLPDYITGLRSPKQSAGSWSWGALRKINMLFKYSGNCPDLAARTKYEAICHCLRGYFYYAKLKEFGGVPWYETVLDDNSLELYKNRDSREFIANKILEELDLAIAACPTEKKLNEITKWTALAVKSRFCLFEGTFLKYHYPDQEALWTKYLQECVSASEQLMDSGMYTIDNGQDAQTAYRDLFIQPLSNGMASTTEVIYARSYSLNLGIKHNTNYYINNISGSQYGLDKSLIDSYLMRDGKRFTAKSNYDKLDFYHECVDRDPRLSQTIRTPKFVRVGETRDSLAYVQEAVTTSTTGYMPIKYIQDASHDMQSSNDNDLIAFRYAEVLLNFAEAKAELGTITQEDLDRSISLIRARVGMPALKLLDANNQPCPFLEQQYPLVSGVNKGVILEIRRERRVELVMEGLRYDDLMRYKAGKLMEAQSRGIYVPLVETVVGYSLSDGSDLSYDPVNGDFLFYRSGHDPVRSLNKAEVNKTIFLSNGYQGNKIIKSHQVFTKQWREDRDYLAPIPESQTLLNKNLEQNPNW